MKLYRKRLAMILVLSFVVCFLANFSSVRLSALGEPSRIINIVYDDSGSMYTSNKVDVDTWCQAKYSMEVFAAMMGNTDTMNIYYMSDFDDGAFSGPRLTLAGSNGSEANVQAIHNEKTKAKNTPFNSVRQAYSDLYNAVADEKWLVVLTDGAFEDGAIPESEVNGFFSSKADDISVCFLAIGPEASVIADAPQRNIYSYHATTNSDILINITDISSRIFQRNKLNVNVQSGSVSFDVPMQELVVFAQGEDVSINGISSGDGSIIKSATAPVRVSYSLCDAVNKQNQPTTDLQGAIATFQGDYNIGTYTVNVDGAETLEVYYKPNVMVTVALFDSEGNPVTSADNIQEGDYTLDLGLANPITGEVVNSSSDLLGTVDFNAILTNNDVTHDQVYANGSVVHIEEGTVKIIGNARYLDYNYLSTEVDFSAIRNKLVTFSVVENPTYNVISKGFEKQEYIIVHAMVDGREFTEQEWEIMTLPQVSINSGMRIFKIGDPVIEKTDKVGDFRLYPTIPGDKPSSGTYSDCDYTLKYSQYYGPEIWSGEIEDTIQITDSRSWWERNWVLFLSLVILGIILLILAGYLPFIKNYLPRSLKAKPYIRSSTTIPGKKPKDLSGEIKKSFISTIIPYIPQTGTIKYVPKGYSSPLVKVRAARQKKMVITNCKAFAGKKNITFEGESIDKDTKEKVIGAGTTIEAKLRDWKFTCYPNQKKA